MLKNFFSISCKLSANSKEDAEAWIDRLLGQLCKVGLTKGIDVYDGQRAWYYLRFSHISTVGGCWDVYLHGVKLCPDERFLSFESGQVTWMTIVRLVSTVYKTKFEMNVSPPPDVEALLANGNKATFKFFLWTDAIANTESTYDVKKYTFWYFVTHNGAKRLILVEPLQGQESSGSTPASPPVSTNAQPKPTVNQSLIRSKGVIGSDSVSKSVINPPPLVTISPTKKSSSSPIPLSTNSLEPTKFNTKCPPTAFLSVNDITGKWELRVLNKFAWEKAGMTVYNIYLGHHPSPERIPPVSEIRLKGFTVEEIGTPGIVSHFECFQAAELNLKDIVFVKAPTAAKGYRWQKIGEYKELMLGGTTATLCKDVTIFTKKAYSIEVVLANVAEDGYVVTSITNDHSFIDPVDYKNGRFISTGASLWFRYGEVTPRLYIHVYLSPEDTARFIGTLVVADKASGSSKSEGYPIDLYYDTAHKVIAKPTNLRFVVSWFIVPKQYSEIHDENKQIYENFVENRLILKTKLTV